MSKALLLAIAAGFTAAAENYSDEAATAATPAGKPGKAAKKSDISLDSLKEKLSKVIKEKGRDTAVGLLKKYKAAKLSDVSEDNYEALDKAADAALEASDDDI